MNAPLHGLRVVEAAGYVTGPYAAMMLGDLGADVIKVEPPPKGDPMRNFGQKVNGTSLLFANTNRNKRSALVDLKTTDGRDAFIALARTADVFISNWRPGVADSLGLSDAVLEAANPAMVRASVTGFGADGPLAHRPAFDGLLQAQTGLAHRQGAGRRPEVVRAIVADKTTAMFVTQAVLSALVARSISGLGARIDLAMIDVMAYANFSDVMQELTAVPDDGSRPEPRAAGRSGVLETSDGYILVAPVSGAQIGRCLEAVGHAEWKPEFKAITDPHVLHDTMLNRMEEITRTRTTADWLDAFDRHDVPAAPVLTPSQHVDDPQVVHNGTYVEVDHPHLGRMRQPRHPARFRGASPAPLAGVPMPGEHTEAVMAEVAALAQRQ